jgi:hypothetical protein
MNSSSPALRPMRFAPGETPLREPADASPLPATVPATCVPWPDDVSPFSTSTHGPVPVSDLRFMMVFVP